MGTHEENADVEFDICDEAFDMWFAEKGFPSATPPEFRRMLQDAFHHGWLGGLERGVAKGANVATNAALKGIEQFGSAVAEDIANVLRN